MYKKKTHGLLKHIDFVIIDVISAELAFLLAFLLRQGGSAPDLLGGLFSSNGVIDFNKSIFKIFFILILFLCIADDIFMHSHKNIIKRDFLKELKSSFNLSFAIFIEMLVIMFMLKVSASFSRLVLFYFLLISSVLLTLFRTCYKQVIRVIITKDNYHQRHMLVLSTRGDVEEILERFGKRQPDIEVTGLITMNADATEDDINGVKIVAKGLDGIVEYCKSHWVDEIYVSSAVVHESNDLEQLFKSCNVMGITTHWSLNLPEEMNSDVAIESLAGHVVITESIRIIDPMLLFVKRVLDILGSLVGLFFCGIFTVFIAIPGVLINDPGPLFYKQKRVGKNGRVFNLYKFRSMYMDADKRKAELMDQNEMQGAMFKMKNDPRIIGSGPDGSKHGYGWFIRKFSIDEFPQFLNVFLGQMSLVGTRPPTVDEWKEYEAHHRVRLAVRPGITGVWQTSGRNEISDFEEIVRLDLSYINNFTIGNDFRIIGRTVSQIFKGGGGE